MNQEESFKLVGDLADVQQSAQSKLKEYQTHVQMALAVLKNLAEVETMIEIIDRKSQVVVYQSTSEVDMATKEHQATGNTVAELLKLTRHDADQLIHQLRSLVRQFSIRFFRKIAVANVAIYDRNQQVSLDKMSTRLNFTCVARLTVGRGVGKVKRVGWPVRSNVANSTPICNPSTSSWTI